MPWRNEFGIKAMLVWGVKFQWIMDKVEQTFILAVVRASISFVIVPFYA